MTLKQTKILCQQEFWRGVTALTDIDGLLAIATGEINLAANTIKILKWNGDQVSIKIDHKI